jgi:NADH:ubiquinone oxidoreductase subunit F (NADH-binding)
VSGAAPLPRLLAGLDELPTARLDSHLDVHGPLPNLHGWAPGQIVDLVEQSGLRGRGGAAFPAARKLDAVASRRGPKVIVANGVEGEPASKKDRALLRERPHLVLDGIAVAARAVGAGEAIVAFSERDERSARGIELALGERRAARIDDPPRVQPVAVPERFISGQESALINALAGAEARPSFQARPYERGVRRLPTLVQNVETLAHLALIIRHGARWFRELGTDADPGSTLVTVSGAVSAPGVYEIERAMALGDLLASAGRADGLTAVLVGGYFGSWLLAASLPKLRLSNEHLAPFGASVGAGVIIALSSAACPVAETARVADYLAAESARQCGPCIHGLDAIADTVQRLAQGIPDATALFDLERWIAELPGRGACHHPDGAARFIASSLRVFANQFREHARRGPCERCPRSSVLPVPLGASAVG